MQIYMLHHWIGLPHGPFYKNILVGHTHLYTVFFITQYVFYEFYEIQFYNLFLNRKLNIIFLFKRKIIKINYEIIFIRDLKIGDQPTVVVSTSSSDEFIVCCPFTLEFDSDSVRKKREEKTDMVMLTGSHTKLSTILPSIILHEFD